MSTCENGHPITAYGIRFCMFCGTAVPYVGDPSVRREFMWVPANRRVQMPSTERPVNVWTVVGAHDPATPPGPIHGEPSRYVAFHEDLGHDWNMEDTVLRYFSRGVDHSVWIMCEYPAKER